MTAPPDVRLVELGRDDLRAAVRVLTRAFAGYPLMAHLHASDPAKQAAILEAGMEFSCVVRFELGWPLIGALVGGELAGVVGLTDIDEKPWPASLADYYQTMTARIGSEAAEWLERYAALADTHKPNAPHYGVGVIGVDPTYQGRGVARALLEWLHGVSDADPRSTGVYLDTETAENVRFYEHLGYQVIGHERLGDLLDIWCMFRPK